MNRLTATVLGLTVLAAACATVAACGEDEPAPRPVALPDGPTWGRGRFRPEASNVLFATADGCALCHSAGSRATALRNATGDDVSPYGTWRATMMANAFRDPYWRAQVAREIAADPEHAAEIQALCIRCHGPMTHHTARLSGEPAPPIAAAAAEPLARDGVSCTVCHQIQPDGLGDASTFSGQPDIRPGRRIFGPYPEPFGNPMRMHSAYQATEGPHVRSSGLCATCHTLFTSPGEDHAPFPEQTPYLEWRNSAFAGADGRTCQQCHMQNVGSMRIARNPGGRDFNIPQRPDVRAHSFVGGNAFVLGLLQEHRAELDVQARDEDFSRTIAATRRYLRTETARLTVGELSRAGGTLAFDVGVENLTGHKLPTGYPARRAWLRVQVRSGRSVLFDSGAFDERGRLTGPADPTSIPHRDVIDDASQVVVYECVPTDTDGQPTTLLHRMAGQRKDNRLLPRGWRADGPDAAHTRPVGTSDDEDFVGGRDTVSYRVALPDGTPDGLLVVAWLLYQPVPPRWVEPLGTVEAPEARAFVKMYAAADPSPETISLTTRSEGR